MQFHLRKSHKYFGYYYQGFALVHYTLDSIYAKANVNDYWILSSIWILNI